MSILEKLRQQQRAAGLPPAPSNPEAPVDIPGWNKRLEPVVPQTQTPTAPVAAPEKISETLFDIGTQRGYIKIFPATVPTMKDLKPEWIAENWTKPSPWCSIEGQPTHPEFEKNLRGLE
jgi:hypothetical protein